MAACCFCGRRSATWCLPAARRSNAGSPRSGPHPACDVRDGDVACFGDRLRARGCNRPRPIAARSFDEARGRPLSGERATAGLAIDHQPSENAPSKTEAARAEDDRVDYIFGLAGNTTLDALVAKTADNLRFHHAKSSQTKLRTYASIIAQVGSWTRPRKAVARLECSLQPDAGDSTSTAIRQEVDIRYSVTPL